MDFTPDFESGQEEESELADKAEQALQNRTTENMMTLVRTLIAAGLLAAGAHSMDNIIDKTARIQDKIENVADENKEYTNSQRAKAYVKRNLPDTLKDADRQVVIDQVTDILDNYGVEGMRRIDAAHEQYQDTAEKEKEPSVEISGFEDAGLSSKKLRNLWSEDHYPEGTIKGKIESIVYADSTYATTDTTDTFRAGDFLGHDDADRVRFFKPVDVGFGPMHSLHTALAFDVTFAHELTHANDWVANDKLTLSERIELFHDTHEVFQQSEFVDSLDTKSLKEFDQLTHNERLDVLKEWFAEVGEMYFSAPEDFQNRYPQAYELADQWLARKDPNYDPEEALRKREILYGDMEKKSPVFKDEQE